jgi:hypothetical protein
MRPFALKAVPAAFAGAIAILCAGGALAQSACERYRAELASLGRGGPDQRADQYYAAAERQANEIERTRAYYAQIGCGRPGGGGPAFFNAPPSPECGALGQRIRAMEANLGQLRQQAAQLNSGNVEARRRQLMAAIDQACRPGVEQARQPNFFERLFGAPAQPEGQPVEVPITPEDQQQARLGGSRTVCVRTCDGYFFPLPTGGREGAAEMCQALCPAAQTEVFNMQPGGQIERAASQGGKAYTDLQNASVYERSLVPSCSCKAPGQTWAQALAHAEALLDRRKGDMIVTAEKAEELSRPKVVADKKDKNGKTAKGKDAKTKAADDTDTDAEKAIDQSSVPTAGQESAGIGPQTITEDKTVTQREGQYREIVGPDGKKEKIRVVAPNIFTAPDVKPQGK